MKALLPVGGQMKYQSEGKRDHEGVENPINMEEIRQVWRGKIMNGLEGEKLSARSR